MAGAFARESFLRIGKRAASLREIGFEPADPGVALAELAFQPADRHVAPAEFLHGAGLCGETALGILLGRAHAQGEFGPQMVAIRGDFGERERERRLGPLARQPVGPPRQRRHGRQSQQGGAEEAEREQHGGFDQISGLPDEGSDPNLPWRPRHGRHSYRKGT